MELTPLRRASSGAVLGGVCAGLARRWQVDPTVLRIAMVLLCLIGGLGVAFYVGALLLVPKDGSTGLPLNRLLPFTRSWSPTASIGAVVGLGVLITILIGSWLPLGIAPAVGLGFLWYFGVHRRRQPPATSSSTFPASSSQSSPSQSSFAQSGNAPSGSIALEAPPTGALQLSGRPTEPMTEFEQAAAEWQQRVAEERWARSAPASAAPGSATEADLPRLVEYRPTPAVQPAPWSASDPVAQPVPDWTPPTSRSAGKPRPGWLWPLVLCLVGGGLASLAVLDTAFGMIVAPIAYAGTVLGALGIGLLIAAFAGRPRGLLPLSVLAGLVTVALLLPMPRVGPVGDTSFSYTSTSQLPTAPLNHGAGDVALDLSTLSITETRRLELANGVGDVNVTLPAAGNLVVEWKVGLGGYVGPDGPDDGVDLAGTYRRVADPSAPTLTLVLKLGAGDLQVRS